MFKLPWVPESIPSSNHQYHRAFQGIPCFRFPDFKRSLLIEAGGFGNVYHGKFKDKDVVVKQIEDASEKEIMKEARFLHHLQHQNLVKFHGMCLPRKALMLEYVEFDLSAFGVNRKLSSLDALLQVLSKGKFISFEHLIPHIAEGISLGLAYLHKQGVAHRDLKPSNILVGNQHFLSISDEAEGSGLENSPCVAKLTDFGESWGKICQTSQIAHTHTHISCF